MKTELTPFQSIKLISLNKYFVEMVKLFELGVFPKVFLLSGQKGIGKFTLIFHFLNYIFSKNEKTQYNFKDNVININSNFYKSVLNQNCADVIFLKAEEGKNIKIEDIRELKSILSKSTLSNKPRFTVIDEVEFLNINSVNALLKTLEEPSKNNYFILINNQQSNLIETISSRCLKNNIYLNSIERKIVIKHLIEEKRLNLLIEDDGNLSPGLLLVYNELSNKYKITQNDNMFSKLNKLLHAYKKDKNKALINMSVFLIDQYFYQLLSEKENKIEFLLNLKSIIINKINEFFTYNLNINLVLNFIELKLKNVR
jgi:DNA polymerase-3 subunit delta'|tara:strand:- start:293 stop:1231 length:939 start_codon:yes stop_codon:yes gene_type:complete